MTVVPWPDEVNTQFYAYSSKPKDNVKSSDMMSGRVVAFQLNTRALFQVTCSLRLSIKTGELARFWNWYNDELGGTAGAFTCAALGDKHYRFTDIPDPADTEQLYRELSLSIEEVY